MTSFNKWMSKQLYLLWVGNSRDRLRTIVGTFQVLLKSVQVPCLPFRVGATSQFQTENFKDMITIYRLFFLRVRLAILPKYLPDFCHYMSENLGFKSPSPEGQKFFVLFLFIFKFFTQKWISFILTTFLYLV